MYIQEVIIDGFKSYAQKTVVSGFDPQFNAITGLNGTGKSNILDSICFVLGIQNLSQVRVGNLQELVYKQGQAGVTKASVTIIFNNADPSTSPVGYESHKQITVTRQVVIGGKNKYMVNGHTVQQNQVQNLFHSVQLNVNNPHFLIMQGRITKVLNMKPPEILSMIEEAAGTRMFENKKQASLKTIEKKQLKVDEITKCIEEEITPTLDSLRHERADYHTWQANNAEYERLEKFCTAFEFTRAEQQVLKAESEREKNEGKLSALQAQEREKEEKVAECKREIEGMVREREERLEGEGKSLKKRETELSKEVVKLSTLLTNQQENLKGEEENIESIERQIEGVTGALTQKAKDLESSSALYLSEEKKVQAMERDYQTMKEKYNNARAGVADASTAHLLSLPDQLLAWEKVARESRSKIQQSEQKLKHLEETLGEMEKKKTLPCSLHQKLVREKEEREGQIASLQAQLLQLQQRSSSLSSSTPSLEAMTALRREADALHSSLSSLSASISARVSFEYSDPTPRFDRNNRVLGCIAKLFSLSSPLYATALEVTAAGKLTQIVVDTEETGKLLLQRGQLKRRVTILPLNKLNARPLSPDKVQQAKAIARELGGEAFSALELINYEQNVSKAMEHTFGSVIVCSSPAIAKAITFNKALKLKTVTREGDVYDPSGVLSGGSASNTGTLLTRLFDYQQKKAQYEGKIRQLQQMDEQVKEREGAVQRERDLQSEIEMESLSLSLCCDKLKETNFSQKLKKKEEALQEKEKLLQEREELVALQQKAESELISLSNMKDTHSSTNKLKEFEQNVQDTQKSVQKLKASLQQVKQVKDTIVAEIKELEREKKVLHEQKEIAYLSVQKLKNECTVLHEQLLSLRAEYESVHAEYVKVTQDTLRKNKEIQSIEQNMERYVKETQQIVLEMRKLTHSLKTWEKDCADATHSLARMLKQFPWIEREKVYFGQVNTDYDFQQKDMAICQKRLKELKAEQERLSKKINKKVMGMIETAEAEYAELTKKREVILNDKAKIENVIAELDVQKVQALQKTYTQVNRDFGSIFSMLLPGTTAKLSPLDNDLSRLMEGLEVKVAFNNVWKESLTELSGGQRSLLALSLILALLLFKPAPMYILDEVDAALDLSHTQNIGMMIRSHFANSQFIVVSLKEGMFNNANVIFRTKFVDGISMVTRTVAGARASAHSTSSTSAALLKGSAENEGEEDEAEELPAKKKGKKVGAGAGKRSAQSAVEVL